MEPECAIGNRLSSCPAIASLRDAADAIEN